MQKLIELLRSNAGNSLLLSNTALFVHLNCNLKCRESSTLTNTSLKHPELTILNGELDVHHVCVMILKNLKDVEELLACLLECRNLNEVCNRLSITNTSNNVLALSVDQEVAVALVSTICRVTSKCNASCRSLTLVTKDHDLNVNCSTKLIRNLVLLAVKDCAVIHPRTKDCLLSKAELKVRIRWEDSVAVLGDLWVLLNVNVCSKDTLEPSYKVTKVICVQLCIKLNALLGLLSSNCILKELSRNAHNNAREHLNKTTVRVPSKALITSLLNKALNGLIVKTKVKNSVHHARHGEWSTGTNGDKQWIFCIAELLAHALLKSCHCSVNLISDALRPDVAVIGISNASLASN